jgi:hypothetical protein
MLGVLCWKINAWIVEEAGIVKQSSAPMNSKMPDESLHQDGCAAAALNR